MASLSGVASGMLSDLAERCGIEFAALPATAKAQLEGIVPEFGSVNPLDLAGQSYDTHVIDESQKSPTISAYDVIIWAHGYPGQSICVRRSGRR